MKYREKRWCSTSEAAQANNFLAAIMTAYDVISSIFCKETQYERKDSIYSDSLSHPMLLLAFSATETENKLSTSVRLEQASTVQELCDVNIGTEAGADIHGVLHQEFIDRGWALDFGCYEMFGCTLVAFFAKD